MHVKILLGLSLCLSGIALILSPVNASAEQGCPSGMVPNPGNGGTAGPSPCIPAGSVMNGIPQLPPGFNNGWGAIFYDAEKGLVGVGEGETSRGRARKAAEAECRSKDGTQCKEQLNYKNQCAAVVWGPTTANKVGFFVKTALGGSPDLAISNANAQCKEISDTRQCEVFYAGCSMPQPYG